MECRMYLSVTKNDVFYTYTCTTSFRQQRTSNAVHCDSELNALPLSYLQVLLLVCLKSVFMTVIFTSLNGCFLAFYIATKWRYCIKGEFSNFLARFAHCDRVEVLCTLKGSQPPSF